MERELLLTGIGGQGIQLAAAVLARAALVEGREVQVFGSYGGMMRGGATEATRRGRRRPDRGAAHGRDDLVGAASCTTSTPSRCSPRLRVDGAWSSSTPAWWRPGPSVRAAARWSRCRPPIWPWRSGNVMAASMVMLGAYAAATGLVALDAPGRGRASASAAAPTGAQHAAAATTGPLPGRRSTSVARDGAAWPDRRR